jgi:hypothetical protein
MWARSKHQPIVHATVYCSQSDWHLMFGVTQWAYDCRPPFNVETKLEGVDQRVAMIAQKNSHTTKTGETETT